MGLAAGAIPRAARTETRVTGATFDPTRGGFAGANIDVRLGPGDRFYQRRNAFVTLDPQQFQFTDATARSLGARSGGARGSVGADGEFIRQAATYNMALDVARNTSDPATLLDADAAALLRAGVAPDSVARLVAVASPLGLSLTSAGVPTNRQNDAVSWLARLDDTRDTLSTRALTTYAGYTKDGALGFGPLSAPSASGERRERTLGGQLTLGTYVGEGRRILTETRLAASAVNTQVTPYRSVPGANIVVRSSTLDASTDVTGLTLGGGSYLATDDSRWTAEGANETVWNAGGRRHRFKALVWARADGLRQEGIPNQLGTFAFNSIADFAAGHPASFSRTLSQPTRSGSVWNSAAAVAHQWAPTRYFSMLYGARVEADGFFERPARNTALEQALGVQTGAAPSRIHVSPRARLLLHVQSRQGEWLGYDAELGRSLLQDDGRRHSRRHRRVPRPAAARHSRRRIGGHRTARRNDVSVMRRNRGARGRLVALHLRSEQHSFAVRERRWHSRRACAVGDADRSRVRCAAQLARVARLEHELEQAAHSRRRAHVVRSVAARRRGRELQGHPRFTLAGEGGRPVFVSTGAIDPASGSVSPPKRESPISSDALARRVSDLRGYGSQITFGLSPDVFKFRGGASFFGSVNYTLQSTRRQFRGFDGAGFGDPREVEWAPGPNDARHAVVVSTGFSKGMLGTWTLFSRSQSGLPFTPVVQGDVNGDGRGGDRAFIPDPAKESDVALAAQLRALLATGSTTAKECVLSNLGQAAGRNSCRGPWTHSINMQWRPPVPQQWGGRVTERLFPERARRCGSGRARQREHARLGISGDAGSGAARSARLRRSGATVPLRRESPLRRHASGAHARAESVPDRRSTSRSTLPPTTISSSCAVPSSRCGARPGGSAAQRIRSRRSISPTRRASTRRCWRRVIRCS